MQMLTNSGSDKMRIYEETQCKINRLKLYILQNGVIRFSYDMQGCLKMKHLVLVTPLEKAEFYQRHGMIANYTTMGEKVSMYRLLTIEQSKGAAIERPYPVSFEDMEEELQEADILSLITEEELPIKGMVDDLMRYFLKLKRGLQYVAMFM